MDEQIAKILREARTVAVVGLSDNPDRPSYRIARYLLEHGYQVIPVNPTVETAMGLTSYPSVAAIPQRVDVVDVFRRSDQVGPVVADAVAAGARVVWMQEGVVSEEAAARARAQGLEVVMDRCIMKEHQRLQPSAQWQGAHPPAPGPAADAEQRPGREDNAGGGRR